MGCGCRLREDAAESDDPVEAKALAEAAPLACARWQCPAADERAWVLAFLGAPPPPDAAHLDDGCREVLVAVERLTGARGLTTCPLYYTRLPWVAEAADARTWAERGDIPKTAVLKRAVTVIDRGVARQQRREQKRRAAELEAQRLAAGAPPPRRGRRGRD